MNPYYADVAASLMPMGPPAPTMSIPAPPMTVPGGAPYDFNTQVANALGPAPAPMPPPAPPPPQGPAPGNPFALHYGNPILPDVKMGKDREVVGGANGVVQSGPPPSPVSGGPVQGPPAIPQQKFPLVGIPGGGGAVNMPAKETEMRGPTLLNAQDAANAAQGHAIQSSADRTQAESLREQEMYMEQERRAAERQAAAERAAAERAQDQQQRLQDFDDSVKQLSSMSMDPNRFWASRTTGQKVAGYVSIALGGFLQGMRGGANPGLDIINQAVERDLEAQKFAYNATRDTAAAKQTAFSLAMQKYGSEDAAMAAARAAAMDSVQAQLGQAQARLKGTAAASQAELMSAQIQQLKEEQIARGVAFQPARQVMAPRMFYDPATGLTYNEAQAREIAKDTRGQNFDLGKQELGIEGAIRKEEVTAAGSHTKQQDEGAHQISNQLQQAGVPQARSAAQEALVALNKSAGGVGETAVRGAFGKTLGNAVMSDDANAREQSYANFENAAIKAMMGNATPGEVDRARAALGRATDPESRRRAIAAQLKILDEIERNAKAGASPEAQAAFNQRRKDADAPTQMPGSFTAHGAK